MAGLDFDLREAASHADHDARHAAVAHQQVGAEADDEHRKLGGDAAQEIGEVGGIGRREQHLRRASDAEPRDVGESLIGNQPAAQIGKCRRQFRCQIGKAHKAPPARMGSAASHSGSA